METRTDNEIIAGFMGLQYCPGFPAPANIPASYRHPSGNYIDTYEIHKYSTSWDWLMPVVQAIEEVEETHPSCNPEKGTIWPYHFEILSRNVVQIIDNTTDEAIVTIEHGQYKTKIESVYAACVEFIKFYNKKDTSNQPQKAS